MAEQEKIDFIGILKKSIKNGSMEEWNRQAEKWREQGIKIDLRGVDLTRVALRGVDLRDADLTHVDLRGADLSGAALSGAILSGADLGGADLRGGNLHGAVYDQFTNFSRCAIDGATQLPTSNPSLDALHAQQHVQGYAVRVTKREKGDSKEERGRR